MFIRFTTFDVKVKAYATTFTAAGQKAHANGNGYKH